MLLVSSHAVQDGWNEEATIDMPWRPCELSIVREGTEAHSLRTNDLVRATVQEHECVCYMATQKGVYTICFFWPPVWTPEAERQFGYLEVEARQILGLIKQDSYIYPLVIILLLIFLSSDDDGDSDEDDGDNFATCYHVPYSSTKDIMRETVDCI